MTQDEKKTYLWTAGVFGVLVLLCVAAFATGIIDLAPPAS